MKKLIIAAALAATAAAAIPAMAQTAVSISVGQPNFFGRIDLNGGAAPPPVVYAQPVIVEQTRYVAQPVYLRVPEGHRKHWHKHCREYNACGQKVFFVQDSWYNNTYAPRYREEHYREARPVVVREVIRERDDYRDNDRRDHDRRDHDRDDDRGHGNGNGHGNGHGKGHNKHND
jgi:hypothetical protein